MPIVTTKFVVLTVIVVKKKTKTKMAINAAQMIASALIFKRNSSQMREILEELIQIRTILEGSFGGIDWETYRVEHQQLCEAVDDLRDCFEGCSQYLDKAADRYKEAQAASKAAADKLVGPRG